MHRSSSHQINIESDMKRNMLVGIVLIALGIIALAYQGISYTTREKAIDLGPLQVTRERTERIPLPPVLGALALVGGIVILVMGSRQR
jgi:hypothetical protein